MVIKTSTQMKHHPSITRTKDHLFSTSDLVYFSHLRWERLRQRSRRTLGDYAQKRRVFFVEEPIYEFIDSWWIDVNQKERDVWVVVPHVLDWVNDDLRQAMYQSLVDELFEQYAIAAPTLWYSTPSAPPLSHHLKFSAVIHNSTNELLTAQSTLP
ncbi:hypothetical protein IQ265_22265 [Nodosilinea sp. LEGE 06152]|uniref:hypothetical protein n=1 Tax=Nodosilinea sp. LEGE 06152 TaxID=2777966 RepID=UPI0018810A0E|nr:hypothetical protein [Nodosilinea sp. LEGE 06152]MBE9159535.1 hypothetical protein [Nodosilinea sp. LEGE 06152]